MCQPSMTWGDYNVNDQSLQNPAAISRIKRDRPSWMNVLALVATLLAISGFGGSSFLDLNSGSAKAAGSVAAGTSLWTTNGPYGGQIRSIAIDPVSSATVYAGGVGGVFKSTDGGLNWAPASNGITRYDQIIVVNAVVVSPGNHNTLFAGERNGVYKSVDGGASWSTAGVDLIGSAVIALAIDPLDANKIYLSANARIYRSVDGGNHWQVGFNGLNGTTPYSIAIAPGAVFAGTSNGLFKSIDGGVTWAATGAGFPVGTSIYTFTVLVDPTTPTTLYATPQGRQLYKSIDSGANWRAVGGTQGERFAIDSQTPTTMFLGGGNGMQKSTDGGATWNEVNTGLSHPGAPRAYVNAMAVDSRLAGTVFVGSEGGVFRTINGGNNWSASNTGLANVTVHVVAVDPLTPTTIYAGTRVHGVFKSIDGGLSWRDSSNGLFEAHGEWVVSLAIDPATPSTIYAGTRNFVYKSSDSGCG